jgi:hypothetical protein
MQLTNISISAIKFDNRPFMRGLTATLMNSNGSSTVQATGSNLISWYYPSNTYAVTPQGSLYTSNTVLPVSSIGTLYFYFSASQYDYKTTNYSLCTLSLSSARYTNNIVAQTTSYNQVYDTFPNIDFALLINYQNTNTDTLFYRTTSTNPLTANIKLFSTSHSLASTLSSSTHNAWFTINNDSTKNYLASAVYEFNRNKPCLSSVQATLTASSAPGSLYPFFSAHTLEKELKVYFIPEFPTATFVAYPSTYFANAATLSVLNDSNFQTFTPGICFYGEGHTEYIRLSAANTGNYTYTWKIDNSLTNYTIFNQGSSTAMTKITSKQKFYPKLPISLFITSTNNTYISSSGPTFFYDDTTGEKIYYPFYSSTINLLGVEDSNNTKYKQSISVNPYDVNISTDFNSGTPTHLYLPLNDSEKQFTASINTVLNNPDTLSACYDVYNKIWKWTTFTNCTANSFSTVATPSSWATVECSGTFPKKWYNEYLPTFTGSLTGSSPVTCTYTSTIWTLSAYTPYSFWSDIPFMNNDSVFDYVLRLSGYGGEQTPEKAGFTVSRFSDTNITLAVTQTVSCSIPIFTPILDSGYWGIKETKVVNTFNFTSFEPYKLYVYTPNKYVLLGEPVIFENLFINAGGALSSVRVVLDDVEGQVIYLSGNAINQNFTVSYSSVGDKTIQITGYSPYYSDTYTQTFPNIVRVVDSYDSIEPEAYYSFDKILINLPWKTQPAIGSNDWVVSDNINSCIKMFYDNLNYLNKRSNTYQNTYNNYTGWLGPASTSTPNTTACPVWTWEDIDCTNPENQYYVPWSELMLAGYVTLSTENGTQRVQIDETGGLAQCGTWEQQTCSLSSVVPTCLGKYCLEWRWGSRKSLNSTALVTWRDTKLSASYDKKWRQSIEECETVTNLNCDEGVWNVDLPGFNTDYDPISKCYSQNRCTYTSIASYKNIIYAAQDTQLKLLSSNRTATFFDLRTTFNQAAPFVSINSIALDSEQKIFILDTTLSQITVYEYDQTAPGERWTLFTTFGGVGGSLSKTKFLNPTNIHIDQYDNVWVVDSGNFVLKRYTNTGSWLFTLRDDAFLKTNPPIDVCVDSVGNVHVLTSKVIRVYTYNGEFLFEYTPGQDIITLTGLRKIAASYNREVIYIATKSQVIRHFRTGNYSGTIIDSKQCVDNINGLFHDEYRNLLVANDDKILKFVDTMTLIPLKSQLPNQYWSLNDLLIGDDEYVQNWVYTKVLHRLWDNIEIFRNTLLYDNTGSCKQYKPPIYTKDKITVGQNEIVTSTVINRSLKYLWENFSTLLEYYDPNC